MEITSSGTSHSAQATARQRSCFGLVFMPLMSYAASRVAVLLWTAVTGWSPFVYVGALAWLSHVVVGWATGDRIKSSEHGTPRSLGSPATRLVLATEAAKISSQ